MSYIWNGLLFSLFHARRFLISPPPPPKKFPPRQATFFGFSSRKYSREKRAGILAFAAMPTFAIYNTRRKAAVGSEKLDQPRSERSRAGPNWILKVSPPSLPPLPPRRLGCRRELIKIAAIGATGRPARTPLRGRRFFQRVGQTCCCCMRSFDHTRRSDIRR